jgi:transcriptional regulator with XRE-family HTH domain
MKLRKLQLGKQMNQTEFAKFLDISPNHLSQYYSRKKNLGADTALRISQITRIPIIDLLYPDGLAELDQMKDS